LVGDSQRWGLSVDHATADVAQTVIEGNRGLGVYVGASTVTMEGVQVLDTRPDEDHEYGYGIQVSDQSSLTLTDCLLQDNHLIGLGVKDSSVSLDGVQILGTTRGIGASAGFGLISQESAQVIATDLQVQGTDGPGIYAVLGGRVECTDCTLSDNAFAGAAAQTGGALVVQGSLVEGTTAEANNGGGVGVFVDDRYQDWGGSPSLTLTDSTVQDNEMAAIYLRGAGAYQLTGNELTGGPGLGTDRPAWTHGDAVFVTTGDTNPTSWDEEEQLGVLLQDNAFTGSAGAGVFLDGAGATLTGNTYEGNTTDLVWQACDGVDSPEGLDTEALATTELCPDHDHHAQTLELDVQLLEALASQ
ncbi:MAG: right-handed parallel beta-helix repeat-containing protein, partial [Myxococcota bacterium]|nr:right-handed parallel beta-helix repeat-containing protein [Myxococcota bacterium]